MSKKTEKFLKEIVKRLKAYKPEKIILFGSAGRGEDKINDLDLFLVKDTEKKYHQRFFEVDKYLKDLKSDYPIDILVYTPEEYEKAEKENRYIIEQIKKDGKTLYG